MLSSTARARIATACLGTLAIVAGGCDGGVDTDQQQSLLCIQTHSDHGATNEYCAPGRDVLAAYSEPLAAPLRADGRWTTEPEALLRDSEFLIPTPEGDVTARRFGEVLEVNVLGERAVFALEESGFVFASSTDACRVIIIPSIESRVRARFLGNMIVEALTMSNDTVGSYIPWLPDCRAPGSR